MVLARVSGERARFSSRNLPRAGEAEDGPGRGDVRPERNTDCGGDSCSSRSRSSRSELLLLGAPDCEWERDVLEPRALLVVARCRKSEIGILARPNWQGTELRNASSRAQPGV